MSEQLDQSTIREVKLLERRLHQLEMQVRAALAEQTLDALDDVEVKYLHPDDAPQANYVLTWDPTVSTPYGGLARFAPSVAGDIAVTEALASYSDDGIFSETTYFEFQPQFVVAANSHQLAIVTAYVDGISDIGLMVTGTGLPGDAVAVSPTPWRVWGNDRTPDPDGPLYGAMGTGAGWASFPIWMHNETDAEATHTLYVSVEAVAFGGPEFDATVTVRAESVFQMAALTP